MEMNTDKKMSILMFSGDYDKALAALILANTAKEINVDVTMFFAFWGLMLVRDPNSISAEDKTTSEKMFANMTPRHIEELPLSKMNFAGVGKKMLLGMMDDSDTPKLSDFLNGALKKGVNMKACKLSCEVMGFKEEELLEEVSIVTAEDYLVEALDSNIQLFI
ncbi:DsrE/DsrF/DrsH-like family protein [Tissierella carlieri]|uniref:DsrE/DsrF/DrsH-like family protein n=1 Tax=Tissierella carlieri TaxID=689904 RepID=A0ABT1SAC2_9FIRM|nr:DsrE/DsrF/DrsH-like family protein [Tissierella carlieri]MCQ4923425.1 DsrE/DsrF/DrsH-like family protein [Tissierella carlieri]